MSSAPSHPGFARFLQSELQRLGLDRDQLVQIIKGHPGKARSNTDRWLAGHALPNEAWRARLADALGVDPEVIARAVTEATLSRQISNSQTLALARRPPPMPVPDDDPEGAAAFEPLWSRFTQRFQSRPLTLEAYTRFTNLWGGALPADLQVWLRATGDGIRHLPPLREDGDEFAALLARGEEIDWMLFFGGLLAVSGPDVQDTIFYAVIDPNRSTTLVVRWDIGYEFGPVVALDLPSFAVISSLCDYEFPPDEVEALEAVAAQLPMISRRVNATFPWARWFDAIHDRCDNPPDFDTFNPRGLPDRQPTRHAERARHIIETLCHGAPYIPEGFPHDALSEALDVSPPGGFADFPPRALYWMWLAALNDDAVALARVIEVVEHAPAQIVRDACAHALRWTQNPK